MNIQIHPKIKPLINDLRETKLRYYLASTDFERLCIMHGFEKNWDEYYNYIVKSRNVFGLYDHKPFDSEDAFIQLLNDAYVRGDKSFGMFLCIILNGFLKWSKEEVNLNNIFKDLDLLNISENLRVELKLAYKENNNRILAKNSKNESKINNENSIIITFEDNKKSWVKSIAKAEIDKVVDEIIEFGIDDNHDIIALSSRWHSLKAKYNKGIMNESDFSIENNKLVNALLDFIKNMKNTEGL